MVLRMTPVKYLKVAENMQEKMMDILGPLGYYNGKSYNIYFKYGIIMVQRG